MLTRLFKQTIDFKCIAGNCIDSCCTGWDISLDKDTYENLLQDPDFKKTMDEYSYINDYMSKANINYSIINLTDRNKCPFLDKDNLCSLQKKGGEEELSNVCALYPRYYNTLDGVYEESLSLACIEATEKILFWGPLEIVEVARGPKRDVVLQNIETHANKNKASSIRFLYDFREHIFELLRSEKHTFNEKLGMLMTFHEHIEIMNDDALKEALESYNFNCKKTPIEIDESIYKKLINFLRRVGKSEHTELDELIYACISDSNYNKLMLNKLSSIDNIMSNYLIHQMFKDLYPFISMYNKIDSFKYLLKKVQLLRLLIAYDGHFDDKRVARIIQMYSKGLEHHAVFHYELEDLIL